MPSHPCTRLNPRFNPPGPFSAFTSFLGKELAEGHREAVRIVAVPYQPPPSSHCTKELAWTNAAPYPPPPLPAPRALCRRKELAEGHRKAVRIIAAPYQPLPSLPCRKELAWTNAAPYQASPPLLPLSLLLCRNELAWTKAAPYQPFPPLLPLLPPHLQEGSG